MNPEDYLEPLKETLLRLDDRMEARGWDQSSELGIVVRRDTQNKSMIGVLEFPGWPVVIHECPNAQDAIETLCRACEALPGDRPKPRHYYGVSYAAEAWTLKAPDDLKGLTADEWRAAQGGRIADHPDRIESRIVILAPAIGEPMMLQRDRGGEPKVITQNSFKGHIGGGIPKRLSRLAEALAL